MSNPDREQYCFRCDRALVITATNATIVEFPLTPGFWYIRVTCLRCSARNMLIPMTRIHEAQAAGCLWVQESGTPPIQLVMWCELETGHHFVLSSHDEGEIAFLAWLLDHSPEELAGGEAEAA